MNFRSFFIGLFAGGALGLVPGFALGVFFLPIIIAEKGASQTEIDDVMALVQEQTLLRKSEEEREVRHGLFHRDLEDSDVLHWGEGKVILSKEKDGEYITLVGQVIPGPDFRLYLIPRFVETEAEFLKIKKRSVQVANVKAFKNFRYRVPSFVKTENYKAVLIWCERFSQFITATRLE